MSQVAPKLLERFITAYIEAFLWAENDNSDDSGGEPLDANYDRDDFTPEAIAEIREDCEGFFDENFDDISDNIERAGHDFYLTRNGHGSGFWDGDWPKEVGQKLTKASKIWGTQGAIVGDDGKIHVHR